jgi:polysaccharide biosynthesis/export protein
LQQEVGVKSHIVALLLLAATAGLTHALSAQTPTIQPGDVVRLYSWADSVVRGDFRVDERGIAILPYLGEVSVAGATVPALRDRLRTSYATEVRDPTAIEITPLRRLSVIGDVMQPGVQLVDPTTTLVQALAEAGGITPDADITKIRVVRNGEAIEYDLRGPGADIDLAAVDQIFVPRRSWISRNAYAVMSTAISTTFSLAYLLITLL